MSHNQKINTCYVNCVSEAFFKILLLYIFYSANAIILNELVFSIQYMHMQELLQFLCIKYL